MKSSPPSPSLSTTFALAFALASALAGALLVTPALATEPPDREGLSCTVAKQSLAEGWQFEIVFTNRAAEPVSLPPGPHLVLYRDAAATDAMEVTGRVDRIQRTALVVPAQGQVRGLYGMDRRQAEDLLCNGGTPAAAGLYFYQFSRRPTFRCLLGEARLSLLPMKADCPRGGLSAVPASAPR